MSNSVTKIAPSASTYLAIGFIGSVLLNLTALPGLMIPHINFTSIASTAFSMPRVGLGTMSLAPSECLSSINDAIMMGYRLIDCAPVYFNEKEIGDAFRQLSVPRTDIFITSKLASPFHRKEHVEPALRKTLNDLSVGYLDLYLMHWPVAFKPVPIDPNERGFRDESIDDSHNGKNIDPNVSIRETWQAMETLVDKGLVKHIGVANFPAILLHDLLSYSRIKPAVNQIEIHPYNQQSKLVSYCQARNITVQAYR